MSVFGAAISQLSPEAPDHFGPVSFKSYGEKQGFKGGATPQYISVDSLERLDRELYDFEVVPVYVRIQHDGASLTYNVAECKPLSATPTRTLTSLSVRSARRLRLWTF